MKRKKEPRKKIIIKQWSKNKRKQKNNMHVCVCEWEGGREKELANLKGYIMKSIAAGNYIRKLQFIDRNGKDQNQTIHMYDHYKF